MKAIAVTVEGETIAVVRKYQWQLDRVVRKCYLEKYGAIKLEKLN